MKTIFGVSSTIPSNTRLTNGYTMYDWVMRQRCFPAFWGRNLTGDSAITPDEIEFLHSKDCKILLVFDELTEMKVSSNNGEDDALKAVEAARMLNVPECMEIVIMANIHQDWSVNHNWMLSFAYTIHTHGYRPGFIGNTDSSKNFNFDRQYSHYIQALSEENLFDTVICSTEPKLVDMPIEWTPFCPSAIDQCDVDLWNCGMINFGSYKVDEVYTNSSTSLEFMW